MPSPLKFDFTLSVPSNYNFSPPSFIPSVQNQSEPSVFLSTTTSNIPSLLPDNLQYVGKKGLMSGDWGNYLKRCFIPYYSSSQDQKVSEFFIKFFKDCMQDESPLDREKVKAMVSLADQHVAKKRGWIFSPSPPSGSARLMRYILAIRDRLNYFEGGEPRHILIEKCRTENEALFGRWNKLGFAEGAFWSSPDFVDFVFKSCLHRSITYPCYNHSISIQPCLIRREGGITVVREPHLLVDGRSTAWSEIRKKIHVDSHSRLYSKENGQKKFWNYLDEGLTEIRDDNFAYPHRLKKLDSPPEHCQVQIVTTHAHKEDQVLLDRLLKGTRHSFLRIIPGHGYSVRHLESHLISGEVYSFGWATHWQDFSFFSALSTLKGKWSCPDNFEFLKQDQCITTLDITDEQVMKLLEIIQRRNLEERPFHFITANCCGITAEVLNEAGIIDLQTKNHMSYLGYKLFIPKYIRYYIDVVFSAIWCIIPNIMANAIFYITGLAESLVFAPFFTLLGAWRTNIIYENEDEDDPSNQNKNLVLASNRVKALFSNVFDLLRPSKMQFDLTKNIYKWQKKQPRTIFEKHN